MTWCHVFLTLWPVFLRISKNRCFPRTIVLLWKMLRNLILQCLRQAVERRKWTWLVAYEVLWWLTWWLVPMQLSCTRLGSLIKAWLQNKLWLTADPNLSPKNSGRKMFNTYLKIHSVVEASDNVFLGAIEVSKW